MTIQNQGVMLGDIPVAAGVYNQGVMLGDYMPLGGDFDYLWDWEDGVQGWQQYTDETYYGLGHYWAGGSLYLQHVGPGTWGQGRWLWYPPFTMYAYPDSKAYCNGMRAPLYGWATMGFQTVRGIALVYYPNKGVTETIEALGEDAGAQEGGTEVQFFFVGTMTRGGDASHFNWYSIEGFTYEGNIFNNNVRMGA